MNKKEVFKIVFSPETFDHLRWIERKFHNQLRQDIHAQLTSRPLHKSRNKKSLIQPALFGATWELRCGTNNQFRVLYEVDLAGKTVWILAVGIKQGNQLVIGGEEVEL